MMHYDAHDMSFLYCLFMSTCIQIFSKPEIIFLHFQTKFESFSPVHMKMLNNGSTIAPFSGHA